jgi:GntP family gluconate:H+ symporter
MSPFLVVFIGIASIVIGIAVFKIHPFFALLLAALIVGSLSPQELYAGRDWKGEVPPPQMTRALLYTTESFGGLAGQIAIVIAFAAVIGQAMMESGAADKITRRLLAWLGESRANWALLASGYILAVPVFFDTVFFLLVPLARALSLRTGRNFLNYVMAICAGGVVTHGLVPPTPGPLTMVANLDIDLGLAIGGGFLIGIPVAVAAGILLPRILARWTDAPLRSTSGASLDELRAIAEKPEDSLPSFFWSILPVVLPVVLITSFSVLSALHGANPEAGYEDAVRVTSFLGDKIFSLGLAMAVSIWVLARQKGWSMSQVMESLEPALGAAGTIILITCAGGAFGRVLKETGMGTELQEWVAGNPQNSGTLLILLAWGIAAVMKIAQGSGTAAMVIGSEVMAGILDGGVELPYHRLWIYAAIAYGSKSISWMNDSGFWVVCKMSGFTERETLKTWTVQLAFMSLVGLVEVLILSRIFPLVD